MGGNVQEKMPEFNDLFYGILLGTFLMVFLPESVMIKKGPAAAT